MAIQYSDEFAPVGVDLGTNTGGLSRGTAVFYEGAVKVKITLETNDGKVAMTSEKVYHNPKFAEDRFRDMHDKFHDR